jgi:hypothetical protein
MAESGLNKRAILDKCIPFARPEPNTASTANKTRLRSPLEEIRCPRLRARLKSIERHIETLSDIQARPQSSSRSQLHPPSILVHNSKIQLPGRSRPKTSHPPMHPHLNAPTGKGFRVRPLSLPRAQPRTQARLRPQSRPRLQLWPRLQSRPRFSRPKTSSLPRKKASLSRRKAGAWGRA